jgi:hypothetical protein
MRTTLTTIVILIGMFSALAILASRAGADNAVITAPTDLSTGVNSASSNSGSGNNCANGESIDGSTAEQAMQKFQVAGYTDVKILEKGCDNFWHATGSKGGQGGNIVLSPDGVVMPEEN